METQEPLMLTIRRVLERIKTFQASINGIRVFINGSESASSADEAAKPRPGALERTQLPVCHYIHDGSRVRREDAFRPTDLGRELGGDGPYHDRGEGRTLRPPMVWCGKIG